jgi:hypothetical protein
MRQKSLRRIEFDAAWSLTSRVTARFGTSTLLGAPLKPEVGITSRGLSPSIAIFRAAASEKTEHQQESGLQQ